MDKAIATWVRGIELGMVGAVIGDMDNTQISAPDLDVWYYMGYDDARFGYASQAPKIKSEAVQAAYKDGYMMGLWHKDHG